MLRENGRFIPRQVTLGLKVLGSVNFVLECNPDVIQQSGGLSNVLINIE